MRYRHVILEGKPATGKTEISNLFKIFFPEQVVILPELTTVLVRENGLNILEHRRELTDLLVQAVPARARQVQQIVEERETRRVDDLFCRVRPLVTATDASSQRTTEMEKALKEMSDRVGRYTPLDPDWTTKLEAKLHVLESTFGEKLKLADEKSETIMNKLNWCMNEVTAKVKELETSINLGHAAGVLGCAGSPPARDIIVWR